MEIKTGKKEEKKKQNSGLCQEEKNVDFRHSQTGKYFWRI